MLPEAAARQRLAADVLAGHAFSSHPNGHHIWMALPRGWGRTEFASHVQRQGLAIVTAETFSVTEAQPQAIRVSLGAASSDTWTAGEGVTRGYPYRRVEDAHYARKAEIKASAQGRAPSAIVCQTLDEFIAKSTGYEMRAAA